MHPDDALCASLGNTASGSLCIPDANRSLRSGMTVNIELQLESAELLARPIVDKPGQSRANHIQFVTGESGVWRISAM